MREGLLIPVLCILSAVVATGCGKAHAATVPDGPPLAMPVPPPRIFAPIDEPLTAAPAVPETPVEAPQLPPRPTPRQGGSSRPEPEKPEAAAPPPAPAPDPPRELRAASAPADAEADRKVRALLLMASRNLNNVDYKKLSPSGREQYDQAKSFSEQADEALKQRNYVFAETLADKASKLATELLGLTR